MRYASALAWIAASFALVGCSSSSGGSGSTEPKDGGSHDARADAAPVDAGPPAECSGKVCSSTQFCTGKACTDTTFANICSQHAVTAVLDSIASDDEAGVDLGNAVASSCKLSGNIVIEAQDAGATDPGNGRPVTGIGDLFVAAGGSFGQQAVGYMDTLGVTPVYLHAEIPAADGGAGNAWITDRASGNDIVSTSVSDLTAHHDYFLLELAVEPKSGTLCFFGIGMYSPGTLAAAYWGSTQILPNAANYSHPYYVYEWTDTNMDGTPNSGDTFNMLSSGD